MAGGGPAQGLIGPLRSHPLEIGSRCMAGLQGGDGTGWEGRAGGVSLSPGCGDDDVEGEAVGWDVLVRERRLFEGFWNVTWVGVVSVAIYQMNRDPKNATKVPSRKPPTQYKLDTQTHPITPSPLSHTLTPPQTGRADSPP